MTFILELTSEEEQRLQSARELGIDVNALFKGLIASLPNAPGAANRTDELLAQWEAEDATDDAAEIDAAERELAEFKANINASRAQTGERPIYK